MNKGGVCHSSTSQPVDFRVVGNSSASQQARRDKPDEIATAFTGSNGPASMTQRHARSKRGLNTSENVRNSRRYVRCHEAWKLSRRALNFRWVMSRSWVLNVSVNLNNRYFTFWHNYNIPVSEIYRLWGLRPNETENIVFLDKSPSSRFFRTNENRYVASLQGLRFSVSDISSCCFRCWDWPAVTTYSNTRSK